MIMMMKLRHLFDNPNLAQMLLDNWDYDESSLEMFQYYRISANATYPFRRNGEACLLRFSPTSEKLKENMVAELEFIGYLRSKQYNVLEPVRSTTGDELIQKSTPWGEYYASVFKQVRGKPISESSFDSGLLFAYGASLGHLHKLSSEYINPKNKRWTHADVLDWVEKTLACLGQDGSPMNELKILREYFSTLQINQGNYGLIHYDFEPDNVFYDDSTKSCSVIDFDDAMYHWYVMDVVQALDSLKSEISEDEFPRTEAIFIEGYGSKFDIDHDLLAITSVFGRFANLYRYARIARSLEERWENEPEWLVKLRSRLNGFLGNASEQFGKQVRLEA